MYRKYKSKEATKPTEHTTLSKLRLPRCTHSKLKENITTEMCSSTLGSIHNKSPSCGGSQNYSFSEQHNMLFCLDVGKESCSRKDPQPLHQEIKRYLEGVDSKQRERTIKQIGDLYALLQGDYDIVRWKQKLQWVRDNILDVFSVTISRNLFYYICGETSKINQDYSQAISDFQQSELCAKRIGFQRFLIEIYFCIAECFKGLKSFQTACEYYELALQIAVVLKDKFNQMKAVDNLGMCSYYRGNTAMAIFYHNSLRGLSKLQSELIEDDYRNRKRAVKLELQDSSSIQKRPTLYQIGVYNSMDLNYDLNNVQKMNRTLNEQCRGTLRMKGYKNKTRMQIRKISEIGKCKRTQETPACHKYYNSREGLQDLQNQVLISHNSQGRYQTNFRAHQTRKACRGIFIKLQTLLKAIQ